jgi:hypothetical protein
MILSWGFGRSLNSRSGQGRIDIIGLVAWRGHPRRHHFFWPTIAAQRFGKCVRLTAVAASDHENILDAGGMPSSDDVCNP